MASTVCFLFLFFPSHSPPCCPPPEKCKYPSPPLCWTPKLPSCLWALRIQSLDPGAWGVGGQGLGEGVFSFLLHLIQFSLEAFPCCRKAGSEVPLPVAGTEGSCQRASPAPLQSAPTPFSPPLGFSLNFTGAASWRGLPPPHSRHFTGRCALSLGHCIWRGGGCLRQKMTFEDPPRFTVSGATSELWWGCAPKNARFLKSFPFILLPFPASLLTSLRSHHLPSPPFLLPAKLCRLLDPGVGR